MPRIDEGFASHDFPDYDINVPESFLCLSVFPLFTIAYLQQDIGNNGRKKLGRDFKLSFLEKYNLFTRVYDC